MPFGILDTQYIDFPPNVDDAYLRGLQTRAGVDFNQLLGLIDERLAAFNAGLDPMIARLLAPPTTEAVADANAPVAFVVNERGEYTMARPQYVEGAAIMLPIRGYDVAVGFTEDGLQQMSLERILLNIDSMLLGFRRFHRLKVLERLFNDAELRVEQGTTATSPGFAGSGTGDNVFDQSFPDGSSLPGGYTHYYVADTDNAGELDSTLKDMVKRLQKWFPNAIFDMMGSDAFIDLVDDLSDFVEAGSTIVRPAQGDAEALVDPSLYVGVYHKVVRVMRPINETSDQVAAIFVSNGQLAEGNPLVWRYDEEKGRAAYLRWRDFFPLANSTVIQDFGIGVNNRVAAALIYADSGASAYTVPTFS